MAINPAADVQAILADTDTFSRAITFTAPDGASAELTGFAQEIGQRLSLETGEVVAGAQASLSVSFDAFRTAFGATAMPEAISEADSRPWRASFEDAAGTVREYKVSNVMPDYHLGAFTCLLESYKP